MAWSHGTFSRSTVTLPWTEGCTTMFILEMSWNTLRTSFTSASLRLREMGSPVYLTASPEMVFSLKERGTPPAMSVLPSAGTGVVSCATKRSS